MMPRLAGILIGPGGSKAIFAPDDGKPLVLGVGGRVAGATVRAIGSGVVELSGPTGRQILRPSFSHTATAQATAGPQRLFIEPTEGVTSLPASPGLLHAMLPGLVPLPEADARASALTQTPPGTPP